MRKLKTVSMFLLIVVATAVLYLLWETRSSAIPGIYHATGVWGSSTLTLGSDHTITQELNLVNQYTGEAAGPKTISGRWEERGRNVFDQEIVIKPFMGFGAADNRKVYDAYPASYGPVALSGLGIEVDISQGIVYRK
jgi:hypothetical protein